MRVLVTGGAGYIGSLVVEELVTRGHDAVVLDAGYWGVEALQPVMDDITFMKGDCRSSKDVIYALDGIDAVLHLAGIVGEAACLQNPKAHFSVNLESTRTVLNCCTDPELDLVRDFIFSSSCSVYGNTHGLHAEVRETTTPHPLSAYAQAKLRSEEAILGKGLELAHFHPTVLRLSTLFGWSPRPRLDLVTNLFTYSAWKSDAITIYGSGEQYRSLVHVEDAAKAFVDVLEAPRYMRDGQIFHVGEEANNMTLNEIAETVRHLLPETRIEHREKKTDRRDYSVNCAKIKSSIGWNAEWTVRNGIEDLLAKLDTMGWYWDNEKYRNSSYQYS